MSQVDRSKIDIARSIIQLKQREQDLIFDKVVKELNIEEGFDMDVLVDYCYNNIDWNEHLNKIIK